jgi:eukaryotic-like serine/threonine-protein kinase
MLASNADFEVLELLGEGGMGRVHLARQRALDREVALKTIKDERVESHQSGAVAGLGAEAIVMGRVEHPNVVPVHMVGVGPHDRLILVMKRIEGVQWRTLLHDANHPHWAVLEVAPEDRMAFHLDVLAQVANALHFAHSRGVVHRDVKPENVMIGAFGEVYLVDWGVALTQDARRASEGDHALRLDDIVGTPAYMAPEAARGAIEQHGPHTDVYLLGATLHEILTGHPRHEGSTLPAVLLAAHESTPFAYPDTTPDELAALANAATAREPNDRPGSAMAFRRALDTFRHHSGSLTLARTAEALLAQAKASTDESAIDRLMVEARFGFVQALRDWSDNAEARTGLRRCLEWLAQREIDRENPAGARLLIEEVEAIVEHEALAESATPSESSIGSLTSLLGALERRLAERETAAARIAEAERDRDLELSWRERTWMLGGMLAIGLPVTVWTFLVALRGETASFEHRDLIVFAGGIMAAYGLALAKFRRKLFANAANRKVTALLGLMFGAFLIHRILAASLGASVVATLTLDQFLLGSIMLAGSLAVQKFRFLAVPWLAGAFVSAIWPSTTVYTFGITSMALLTIVGLRWNETMRGRLD